MFKFINCPKLKLDEPGALRTKVPKNGGDFSIPSNKIFIRLTPRYVSSTFALPL